MLPTYAPKNVDLSICIRELKKKKLCIYCNRDNSNPVTPTRESESELSNQEKKGVCVGIPFVSCVLHVLLHVISVPQR